MKRYYFVALFILGFFFRFFLDHLYPQPLYFDQVQYKKIAEQILNWGIYTHTFRSYGYPLIIAILYGLFSNNALSWKIMQVLLDTLTAVLIFVLGKKFFKKSILPAWIGYVFYLFNPFTAGYVGVLLTEVVTIFIITLIILLVFLFFQRKNPFILFLLGILLGFLPQIKPTFLILSLFLMFLLFIYLAKKILLRRATKVFLVIIIFLLYSVPYAYNVVGNLRWYNQPSPLTVDNLSVQVFYLSLYIDRLMQFQQQEYPPNVREMFTEYSLPKATQKERDQMAQKYLKLSIDEIKKNPVKFLSSRIKKTGYIWEKHYIYPYDIGPNSKLSVISIYSLNLGVLLLAATSFISWLKQINFNKRPEFMWIAFVITSFIIYITIIHAFTSAEERYTLPAYPLVFLFAGYGIWRIYSLIGK